ncbi:NADase-type glycan-binding domain-containing protein [Saccharopolyspora sp. NPDC002376]
MLSCRTCGSQVSPDDDFCGTCGAYLGWESESGADTESAPSSPEAPTQRIPISEPEQPEAVQPAKPIAPRPESTAPVEENAPDGPPCPSCATPNPPDRRFCRRCARPLTAVAEPSTPQRSPRRFRNSDRHKLWRRLIVLGLLIALVVGAVLLYPLSKAAVQDVLDKTSDTTPIRPANVTASAAVPGHPASNLADVRTDVYWGAPAPGAWADFTFDQPYRLVGMLVHIGPSTKPDAFPKQARPTQLDIIITDAAGRTRTVHANLADQPKQPQINIGASDVTHVRIVIREATGLTEGKHIAMSLVEFFKRV